MRKIKYLFFGLSIFLFALDLSTAHNADEENNPEVTLSTINDKVVNLTLITKREFLTQTSKNIELKSDITLAVAKNKELLSAISKNNFSLDLLHSETASIRRLITQTIAGLIVSFILIIWSLWMINQKLRKCIQSAVPQGGPIEIDIDRAAQNQPAPKKEDDTGPNNTTEVMAPNFSNERANKLLDTDINEFVSNQFNFRAPIAPAKESVPPAQIKSMVEKRMGEFMRPINLPEA